MKQVKKALVVVVVVLKKAILVCEVALDILPTILTYLRKALEKVEEALKRV